MRARGHVEPVTYQPSYVSSNTPWSFDGVRVQVFTSDKLKIEPWLVNGWRSHGKSNTAPGVTLQVLYSPAGWLRVLGNQYYRTDTLGLSDRRRFHTGDSVMVKYYENKGGAFRHERQRTGEARARNRTRLEPWTE